MSVKLTCRSFCAAQHLTPPHIISQIKNSSTPPQSLSSSSQLALSNDDLINVKRTRELLFAPISIGKSIHLSNRFVMQPMYLNLEIELDPWSKKYMATLTTFYAERAHNGVQLIIMGGMGISNGLGKWKSEALTLNSIRKAHAMRTVTSAVHKEGGYILAQAFHPGKASWQKVALSSSSTPWNTYAKSNWRAFEVPRCMMGCIVAQYGRFASLAEEDGFDGMEIPISEGSLLHNFMSTSVNHRTDQFGGKLVNRIELILRVLETIKKSVQSPDNFVVSARLCLHDLKVDGTPMNEILITAEALASSHYVDLLNTSVGMSDSPVQTLSSYVPQGTFARSCKLVKDYLRSRHLTIPVIASHRIHSAAVAERIMERDSCDLIGIARPLLADPEFVHKIRDYRDHEILPCIACNQCVSRLYRHERVTCALNPISGFELEKNWRPAMHKKSVAVVGAGPAGVTCALTLWRRGHDVHLFEKGSVIGGKLNLAKMVPGKESFQAILEYWTLQLRESTIDVHLNTEFTPDDVTRNHQMFNALVLTTGSISRPIGSSKIMGASESKLLVPFESILTGKVQAGRRVAILGMGGNAIDVASFLLHDHRVSRHAEEYLSEWGVNLHTGQLAREAELHIPRNNRDVVVVFQQNVNPDLSRGWGWAQKLWIRRHGGSILTNAGAVQIDSDGLTMMVDYPWNKTYQYKCDTIVVAMGQLPNVKLVNWLHEWERNGAKARGEMPQEFGVYIAGSCRDAQQGESRGEQDLLQAVLEGYEVGYKM